MRKNWCAGWAVACLAAGCATSGPAPGAMGLGQNGGPTPFVQPQVQQASWSQRALAPFGLGAPDPVAAHQDAMAAAKAKEAQRQSQDRLALDNKSGEPTPAFYVSMAEFSYRGGNVAQARQLYQKALAMQPKSLDALLGAARMEDREGRLDVATMLYQRAADAYPNNPTVMNDLGLCLARQGKLQDAERAVARAVQLAPGKALYRNNLAKVEIELNRFDAAVTQLAAVYPRPVVSYNMGVLLYQRGRTADAERFLAGAIEADPRMEPARALLAQIHASTPSYQVAMAPPAPAPPTPAPVVVQQAPATPQIIDTGAAAMPTQREPALLPPVL